MKLWDPITTLGGWFHLLLSMNLGHWNTSGSRSSGVVMHSRQSEDSSNPKQCMTLSITTVSVLSLDPWLNTRDQCMSSDGISFLLAFRKSTVTLDRLTAVFDTCSTWHQEALNKFDQWFTHRDYTGFSSLIQNSKLHSELSKLISDLSRLTLNFSKTTSKFSISNSKLFQSKIRIFHFTFRIFSIFS